MNVLVNRVYIMKRVSIKRIRLPVTAHLGSQVSVGIVIIAVISALNVYLLTVAILSLFLFFFAKHND